MLYPNENQVCLTFERAAPKLDAIARDFLRIEAGKSGAQYNTIEAVSNKFYRFYGGGSLMITLEAMPQPANMAVFGAALSSPVTRRLFPDVAQTLTRHREHILINVGCGAMPNLPELNKLMADLDMPREGATLPAFRHRLAKLALLTLIAQDDVAASAVHWTQSDQILKPEAFETMTALGTPGPLHIHPYLFGPPREDGVQKVGIRTFGARHFIGGEVVIEPSALPWGANHETILAFLRVATIDNGYIIPDGDCFGPEDRSLSYRVRHLGPDEGGVPIYELTPLMYREYGFQADDYVAPHHPFDDRCVPPLYLPYEPEVREAVLGEWREKRRLAEGIGGRFEVRPRPAAFGRKR